MRTMQLIAACLSLALLGGCASYGGGPRLYDADTGGILYSNTPTLLMNEESQSDIVMSNFQTVTKDGVTTTTGWDIFINAEQKRDAANQASTIDKAIESGANVLIKGMEYQAAKAAAKAAATGGAE